MERETEGEKADIETGGGENSKKTTVRRTLGLFLFFSSLVIENKENVK